jgi:hypothetical protein
VADQTTTDRYKGPRVRIREGQAWRTLVESTDAWINFSPVLSTYTTLCTPGYPSYFGPERLTIAPDGRVVFLRGGDAFAVRGY